LEFGIVNKLIKLLFHRNIKHRLGLVTMLDKETEVLVKIVLLLESLNEEERDRILTYLDMRYIPLPECGCDHFE
jgi:hypothetical protein